MKTWLRVTLPHEGLIAGILMIYGLLEVTLPPFEGIGPRGAVIRHVADILLVGIAVSYGISRVLAFHQFVVVFFE